MSKYIDLLLPQLDLAGILLIVLLAAMMWIMVLAQRAEGFDLREALLNDEGKVSFLRICSLGAFAASTWALMKDTLSTGGVDFSIFSSYIALWGGMPVASKMIDAVQAKWTK